MPHSESLFPQQILEPDFEDWRVERTGIEDPRIAALRTSARQRFLDDSRAYVSRLQDQARAAGLPLSIPQPAACDEQRPLVMTGHQPTIFHPGLQFKYDTAEQFSSAHHAIGLGIIIDTEAGDPGQFAFPAPAGPQSSPLHVETQTASLCAAAGLFSDCPLLPEDALRREVQRVAAAVERVLSRSARTRVEQVGQHYLQLAPASMLEANLIVRRLHGIGAQLRELPLSQFCVFPETISVIADIVTHGRTFAKTYNELLAEFRSDHRIRNTANPFPDLHIHGPQHELPFWVLDHATQERLSVSVRHTGDVRELVVSDRAVLSWEQHLTREQLQEFVASGFTLVPRGALITALLRVLVSDLFVHGTGGGHYDSFTDRLIARWWKIPPTPFVVASATRILMPARRARLDRLDQIATQLRDLSHNPQRFLGTGIFTEECERALSSLLEEKRRAVASLQQARAAGVSGKEIGTVIQQLTGRIRARVEDEFRSEIVEREAITAATRATLMARTWPWFLYPNSPLSPDAEQTAPATPD